MALMAIKPLLTICNILIALFVITSWLRNQDGENDWQREKMLIVWTHGWMAKREKDVLIGDGDVFQVDATGSTLGIVMLQ